MSVKYMSSNFNPFNSPKWRCLSVGEVIREGDVVLRIPEQGRYEVIDKFTEVGHDEGFPFILLGKQVQMNWPLIWRKA